MGNKGELYFFEHAYTNFVVEKTGEINEFQMGNKTIIIHRKRRSDIEAISNDKYVDFKFSFDSIQFCSVEEKQEVMKKLALKIAGIRTEYTDYKRIRKNDMTDCIISIHLEKKKENVTINNSTILLEPHIHLLIPKRKVSNFGRGYFYLRKEIVQIIATSSLTSSVNTYQNIQTKEKNYRILKDRLTKFSWILEKNKAEYARQALRKTSNSYCINLNTIEKKLNEYLQMGGSVGFVKKIMINLQKKLGMKIVCRYNSDYWECRKMLEQEKYREILKLIVEKTIKAEKIPEIFKDFVIKNRDNQNEKVNLFCRGLVEIYSNRGFIFNEKNEKIIDKEKLFEIMKNYFNKIEEMERAEYIQELKEFFKGNILYDEKDISEKSLGTIFVNRRGEIKYKGMVFTFSEIIGVTRGNYFYENVKAKINNEVIQNIDIAELVNILKNEKKENIKNMLSYFFQEIVSDICIVNNYNNKWKDSFVKDVSMIMIKRYYRKTIENIKVEKRSIFEEENEIILENEKLQYIYKLKDK